jgi:hypothetical protein
MALAENIKLNKEHNHKIFNIHSYTTGRNSEIYSLRET